jgi:uncharacterized protein YdgA (DUF945 family)
MNEVKELIELKQNLNPRFHIMLVEHLNHGPILLNRVTMGLIVPTCVLPY